MSKNTKRVTIKLKNSELNAFEDLLLEMMSYKLDQKQVNRLWNLWKKLVHEYDKVEINIYNDSKNDKYSIYDPSIVNSRKFNDWLRSIRHDISNKNKFKNENIS